MKAREWPLGPIVKRRSTAERHLTECVGAYGGPGYRVEIREIQNGFQLWRVRTDAIETAS